MYLNENICQFQAVAVIPLVFDQCRSLRCLWTSAYLAPLVVRHTDCCPYVYRNLLNQHLERAPRTVRSALPRYLKASPTMPNFSYVPCPVELRLTEDSYTPALDRNVVGSSPSFSTPFFTLSFIQKHGQFNPAFCCTPHCTCFELHYDRKNANGASDRLICETRHYSLLVLFYEFSSLRPPSRSLMQKPI